MKCSPLSLLSCFLSSGLGASRSPLVSLSVHRSVCQKNVKKCQKLSKNVKFVKWSWRSRTRPRRKERSGEEEEEGGDELEEEEEKEEEGEEKEEEKEEKEEEDDDEEEET